MPGYNVVAYIEQCPSGDEEDEVEDYHDVSSYATVANVGTIEEAAALIQRIARENGVEAQCHLDLHPHLPITPLRKEHAE